MWCRCASGEWDAYAADSPLLAFGQWFSARRRRMNTCRVYFLPLARWPMAIRGTQFDLVEAKKDLNWKILANGLRKSIRRLCAKSRFDRPGHIHARFSQRWKEARIKIMEEKRWEKNTNWKCHRELTYTKDAQAMRFAGAWSVKTFIDLFCAVYFENRVARWRVHSTV